VIRGLSRAVSRTARRIYYRENWRHHMTGRQTQAVPHAGRRTSCLRGSRADTGDTASRSPRPATANPAQKRRQARSSLSTRLLLSSGPVRVWLFELLGRLVARGTLAPHVVAVLAPRLDDPAGRIIPGKPHIEWPRAKDIPAPRPSLSEKTRDFLSEGELLYAVWVLVLLPIAIVVIELGPMAREERYMEQKFGDAFRACRPWVRR